MTVVSVMFGLSFLATRVVVAQASPLSLLSWRFDLAFAAMSLLAALKVIRLDLRGHDLRPLILLGVFQPLMSYFFETVGVALTSSSESGLMVSVSPVVTMALAAAVIHARPTKLQAAAVVVSVAGVIFIIAGKGLGGGLTFNLWGYAALLVNVFAGALFQVFGDKYRGYGAAEKTYVMMAVGAAGFTAAAAAENAAKGTVAQWLALPFSSPRNLIAILYLSVCCSVLAFLLQNYAINELGATRCAAFAGLVTVFSAVFGVWLMHETLTPLQLVGAVLVLAGIYGVNWGKK